MTNLSQNNPLIFSNATGLGSKEWLMTGRITLEVPEMPSDIVGTELSGLQIDGYGFHAEFRQIAFAANRMVVTYDLRILLCQYARDYAKLKAEFLEAFKKLIDPRLVDLVGFNDFSDIIEHRYCGSIDAGLLSHVLDTDKMIEQMEANIAAMGKRQGRFDLWHKVHYDKTLEVTYHRPK